MYRPTGKPKGRPLKFQDVEELQARIDDFFKVEDIPTISGLAVHLGTSRTVLVDYEDKEDFSATIKAAKARCEAFAERGMIGGKLNATGSIFSLKNNYGWKDKTEVNQTGEMKITQINVIPVPAKDGSQPDNP